MVALKMFTVKWVIPTACLFWLIVGGWQEFAEMPDYAIQNHSSKYDEDRISNCGGNFKQRSQCTESILDEAQRTSFWNMLVRLTIVIGPPIAVMGARAHLLKPKPTPKLKTVSHRSVKTRPAAESTWEEDPDEWLEKARHKLAAAQPPSASPGSTGEGRKKGHRS
ncbi:MAG: hypothetical protein HQL37_06695 [Alphaproteobacteria bacterium]|nr:hypothetical protein [Alphaproteobacteria bacterium]